MWVQALAFLLCVWVVVRFLRWAVSVPALRNAGEIFLCFTIVGVFLLVGYLAVLHN